MSFRERYKKALAELSEELDKRDKYFFMLKQFYVRNGFVPPWHEESFAIGKKEKFASWRKQPNVVKRIKKTARQIAKKKINGGIDK